MPDMAIPKGLTEFDVDSVNNIRGLRGIFECRWSWFLGSDFCWRMSRLVDGLDLVRGCLRKCCHDPNPRSMVAIGC